jgi:hypothetical protein
MAANIYRRTAQDRLTLDELDLYHRIMDYRASLGLDPVPLSKSLTLTAGRHVVDIRENFWAEDREPPEGANLHSWSDAPYYEDHRSPEAMWEAPARLGTPYDSAGYEIFAAGYRSNAAALQGWKDSPAHDAVITQTGDWASIDFAAIGIGVDRSFDPGLPYAGRVYTAWFGTEPDPAGAPPIRGTRDADRVVGTAFNDSIAGGAGADRLSGGAGNDRLHAGQGSDRLAGGRGNDKLVAGPGPDTLVGGYGPDTFVFRSASQADGDTVTDLGRGDDRLDLSGIDANANRAGHQGFDYGPRGTLSLDDGILAGQVRGGADFEIALLGTDDLSPDTLLL